MKKIFPCALLTFALNLSLSFAASRDAQWKEVDEAVGKGLPKTAIEKLEPIIQGALKDKAWGEATSANTLKKTSVATFDDLLQKGSLPDNYRPTLYDFIAHEALKFYASGEQAAAKPEDAFELSADSPVFDGAEKFMAWDPGSRRREEADKAGGPRTPNPPPYVGGYDDGSPVLKALRLFQDLLKFHRNDKDASAFIDTDIARLVYGYNVAFGEEKNARYKTALKVLVDKWADHELSAVALHHWARVVQSEDDWVEARKMARRGANAFPNSAGGKLCRNLVSEIEMKAVAITTERVWNCQPGAGVPPAQTQVDSKGRPDACPALEVRYRNVTNIYI